MKKFLSAVLAIVLLVTMVVLPVNAEENSSKISMGELVEKVVFSDNFDRADSAKGEIGNGWIVNGLDKYDILKISGNQMQISGSKSFSFINNVIARPENEARLNQKISTNFSGQWWKGAYFLLRMRAGETSGYAGYALELKETYVFIYRILPDGTSKAIYEGSHTKIEKGKKARIEYSAIGSNPTVLSVNIYAVADDNTETLLGSHTYEDNEAHALQTAGTIGISGNDNNGENWNWFKLDNFVYSSPVVKEQELPKDAVFADDFDRADSAKGEIGNGWIVNGLDKYDTLKISGNQMQISGSKSFSYKNNVIARPANEARLNQKISTNFSGQWWNTAFFFLRMRAGENSGYAGYALALKETYVFIYRILPDGTSTTIYEGGHTKIEKGKKARIEYSAIGSNPTVLSVNIYAVADDNTETLLGSHTYEDNEAHVLQTAGTIGISGNDNNNENWNWFKLDNFVYSSPEDEKEDLPKGTVFADNFDRANNTENIGNGWIVNNKDKYDILSIDGKKLKISGKKGINYRTDVIARPDSEAKLNQKISTKFSGQWWNAAHFTLRMRAANENGYAGYTVALKETYVYLYRVLPDGTTKTLYEGRHEKIETNKETLIEYSAIGANPTVLQLNIYALNSDGTQKLLGKHSYSDYDEHELQTPGTIGITGNNNNGENWNYFKLDDFVYSNPDDIIGDENTIFAETFNNGLDDSWEKSGWTNVGENGLIIEDGKLSLTVPQDGEAFDYGLNRPMSEAEINGKVRYELTKADLESGSVMLWLRVQESSSGKTGYAVTYSTEEGLQIIKAKNATKLSDCTVIATRKKDIVLTDDKYILELVATGVNPTILNASLVNVKTEDKLLNIRIEDSTDELQQTGTAGIGIKNSNSYSCDNFVFSKTEPLNNSDKMLHIRSYSSDWTPIGFSFPTNSTPDNKTGKKYVVKFDFKYTKFPPEIRNPGDNGKLFTYSVTPKAGTYSCEGDKHFFYLEDAYNLGITFIISGSKSGTPENFYFDNFEMYEADENWNIISDNNLISEYYDFDTWDCTPENCNYFGKNDPHNHKGSGLGKLGNPLHYINNDEEPVVKETPENWFAGKPVATGEQQMLHLQTTGRGDWREVSLMFPTNEQSRGKKYALSFDFKYTKAPAYIYQLGTAYNQKENAFFYNEGNPVKNSYYREGNRYTFYIEATDRLGLSLMYAGLSNDFQADITGTNVVDWYIANVELYETDANWKVTGKDNLAKDYYDFDWWPAGKRNEQYINECFGKEPGCLFSSGDAVTNYTSIFKVAIEPCADDFFKEDTKVAGKPQMMQYFNAGPNPANWGYLRFFFNSDVKEPGVNDGGNLVLTMDIRATTGKAPQVFSYAFGGGTSFEKLIEEDLPRADSYRQKGYKYTFYLKDRHNLGLQIFLDNKLEGYIGNIYLYDADENWNILPGAKDKSGYGDFSNWTRHITLDGFAVTDGGKPGDLGGHYWATVKTGDLYDIPANFFYNHFAESDDGEWWNAGDVAEKVGTVKGTLTYAEDNSLLAGVELKLVSLDDGKEYKVVTDENGSFVINKIPVGTYEIYLKDANGEEILSDLIVFVDDIGDVVNLDLVYDGKSFSGKEIEVEDKPVINRPTIQKPNTERQESDSSNWIIYIIIAAGVVIVGAAFVIVFFTVRRRKK